MLNRKFLSGVALTALSFAFGGVAAAQETTSAARGNVVSDSGAPIAGARVVITHVPTGTRVETTTNASGVFDARGLRVGGPYAFEFEAQDYRGERVDGVFLTVGDTYRLNVDLEETVGEIIVVARPQADQTIGSVTTLSRSEVEAVVSQNRDVRDLARRSALVTQDVGAGRGGGGEGGISIAGSAPRANRITVDGVQSGDDFGLNTGGLSTLRGPISLEAVEQFAVQAVPLDVENGDFTGGALNIALRQGGNDFEGSLFVNYQNDGMVGEMIRGVNSPVIVTQESWGAFLSGPILKDRLFFALSYETYESANVTGFGLTPSFTNRINGLGGTTGSGEGGTNGRFLTQADVDSVLGALNSTFASASRFRTGSIPLTQPVLDEKYSGRLDWNITDDHRLSYTHRYTESDTTIRNQTTSDTGAGLSSAWYSVPESEYVNSVQLNSNWTDNLSTEIRVSRREYERGQVPLLGRDRGQIQVCLDPRGTPTAFSLGDAFQCNSNNSRATLAVGPDLNRHVNFLATSNDQVQASLEYALGDHLIKAGAHWQKIDIYNLFVPASLGVYYFDSIEAVRQGQLGRFQYANAVSGNTRDAAADFDYTTTTLFLQDTWDLTPNLTLTGGLRYEVYEGGTTPANNPNFLARNGFRNTETYDGRDVLMPRFSFEWEASDRIEVSGGVGLVSGGLPDVLLSNSYSVTGILTNAIDIRRNTSAAGCFDANNPGRTFTAAECTTLLSPSRTSNDSFFVVPGLAQQLVAAGGAPVSAPVNAIAPDFELPSDWRANISAYWDVKDWLRLGVDVVGTYAETILAFRDGRAVPLVQNGQQLRTPDGRLRYDGLSLSPAQRASLGLNSPAWYSQLTPNAQGQISIGGSQDLIAFNPKNAPDSWFLTAALSAELNFQNGLGVFASYTRQESEEYAGATLFGTTAGGFYGEQYTSTDPNAAASGRSNSEIEDTFKLELSYAKDFIEGLETRFTLFGENRSGVPINFTMGGAGGGRNPTFGVSRSDHLLYVPNLNNPRPNPNGNGTIVTDDPIVVFDSMATYNLMAAVVSQFGLRQGGIVEKGAANNPDVNRMDFQFSQELPGLREGHKTRFTVDVSNLLNLLNDDWGVVEEYSNRRVGARVVDAACATTAGVAAGASSLACDRYLYSSPNTSLLNPTRNADQSRWFITLGLRYQF